MSRSSTTNLYDQGVVVRARATFTTVAGGATIDPSSVFFVLLKPDGTTYIRQTYGDGILVKDATGVYHVDVDTTSMSGPSWSYRFYSTGTGQASEQQYFSVRADALL